MNERTDQVLWRRLAGTFIGAMIGACTVALQIATGLPLGLNWVLAIPIIAVAAAYMILKMTNARNSLIVSRALKVSMFMNVFFFLIGIALALRIVD